MAEIVLGLGTSHGPMLLTPPDQWGLRVEADRAAEHPFRGATYRFDELVRLRQDEMADRAYDLQAWRTRHAACRSAITKLAELLAAARPDVVIIVGNDQKEVFTGETTPAVSVYWGQEIVSSPLSDAQTAALPPGIAVSMPGYIPPGGAIYPGAPDCGRHIVGALTEDGYDITSLTGWPTRMTPHAFGFVYRQIMRDKAVPSVPVVLNTFYPPNQPSARRCVSLGQALARAVESWDASARVAVIASGGLTHFVIDEEFDRSALGAMEAGDLERLAALPEMLFQSGTSETKNWIPVASAMASLGFKFVVIDYVPCYRSAAGTGNAMAFGYWHKEG